MLVSQAEDRGSDVESVEPEAAAVSQDAQEMAGCGSVVPAVVPTPPGRGVRPGRDGWRSSWGVLLRDAPVDRTAQSN